MKFGICGGPECTEAAARAGFEFFEWTVGGFLKPREPKSAFDESWARVRAASLPCIAVNCFLPGDLKVTGPDVNFGALRDYTVTTFDRAAEAGVKTVVFGSGSARKVPNGFSMVTARLQVLEFCAAIAPLAQERGITVVIEPLNRKETNTLNSVRESAALVRKVNHPGLRLLVDAYHWALENEPVTDIAANGDILRHVHIATKANRWTPGAEPQDFGPFFRALQDAGYDGAVSVEAKIQDPAIDLPRALATMQTCAAPSAR